MTPVLLATLLTASAVADDEDRSILMVGAYLWWNETRYAELTRFDDELPETVPLNALAIRTTYSQRLRNDWFVQAGLNGCGSATDLLQHYAA